MSSFYKLAGIVLFWLVMSNSINMLNSPSIIANILGTILMLSAPLFLITIDSNKD